VPQFSDQSGMVWSYKDKDKDRIGDASILSEVFSGRSADGRPAAIKRVPIHHRSDAAEHRRDREVQVTKALTEAAEAGADTSHLVLPYDHGFSGLDLMIAMPLADESLSAALPLDRRAGLDAFRHVALGLAQLADLGVAHRDIKPANVLRFGSTWKISDFGISRLLSGSTGTYTLDGWGTPAYKAPELWEDRPATPKVDLYALGVLGYEILLGSLPFPGPDFANQHLTALPPEPVGLPPQLARLLLRLLAKKMTDRPQHPWAVVEEIDNLARPLTSRQNALVGAALRNELKLRPPDVARFGELFRQGGRWQGKQIVPAGWVSQATTAQAGKAFGSQRQSVFDPDNYGYLWWVDKGDGTDAYFAYGYGGQRIEVVPDRHLTIVISTDVDFTNPRAPVVTPDDTQRLLEIIAPLAR
jgi:serine/threonine protein kinase